MTLFEKFLIAHLVGDYLLQNNWMALNKSKRTPTGTAALLVHSFIYGFVFGVVFQDIRLMWIVFSLHGLFDYFPITEKWLQLIKGRSLKSCMVPPLQLLSSQTNHSNMIYCGFSTVVYCVVDFLIHFITTYPIIKFIIDRGEGIRV